MVEPDLSDSLSYVASCEGCGRNLEEGAICRGGCGAPIRFRYASPVALPGSIGSMWDFRRQLPLRDAHHAVTLGEGGTALLAARADSRLYWKAELANPTGSQKDRPIAVAISKARELRAKRVVITSTGSAGIACAAYCARAGLDCVVLVGRDLPRSRAVAMMHVGANVLAFEGSFADAGSILDAATQSGEWYRAGTNRRVNPYQAEGTKTIAYEILAQHGRVPTWVVCGVGGGGTLASVWRGFLDLQQVGLCPTLPRMVAVHPKNVPRFARAFEANACTDGEVERIDARELPTCMDNLRAGRRSDLADAVVATRDSGGFVVAVTEDEARDAQRRMAREEGLYPDLSASAAVAAGYRLAEERSGFESAVVIVSGAGYRDETSAADSRFIARPLSVDAKTLGPMLAGLTGR